MPAHPAGATRGQPAVVPPADRPPAHDGPGGLPDVLPAVARSLGVALEPRPARAGALAGPTAPALRRPAADRACVLLVDGLGELLLRERAGHAPFLRGLLPTATSLHVGFPTTTATSMGSLGTGLPPGQHGLVGYEVLVPERDTLLNELSWEPAVDPRRWQPATTVFQQAAAAGLDVVRIGPGFFDGSGLTEAALRGGRFVAADSLEARVDAALAALRGAGRALVYVYWGDLDKVGHVEGCGSWQWGEELERVDAAVRRLAAGLPARTALHVTADHGMVDVPHADRLDLADEPALMAGVRHLGGEARAPQLYCEPGTAAAVAARWRERLAAEPVGPVEPAEPIGPTAAGRVGSAPAGAAVLLRAEAVAAGWFGPVAEHVLPRIGDVVVACGPGGAVVHSGRQRRALLRLKGLHGSRTPHESLVPLLSTGPATAGS